METHTHTHPHSHTIINTITFTISVLLRQTSVVSVNEKLVLFPAILSLKVKGVPKGTCLDLRL